MSFTDDLFDLNTVSKNITNYVQSLFTDYCFLLIANVFFCVTYIVLKANVSVHIVPN